jgi:hypothetical protein
MGWRLGSSSSALALQVGNPEFKPQYCKRKSKVENIKQEINMR